MYNLYIFTWYDEFSDLGWNQEYLITNEPVTHARSLNINCKYKEFKQEDFVIQIFKVKGGN